MVDFVGCRWFLILTYSFVSFNRRDDNIYWTDFKTMTRHIVNMRKKTQINKLNSANRIIYYKIRNLINSNVYILYVCFSNLHCENYLETAIQGIISK